MIWDSQSSAGLVVRLFILCTLLFLCRLMLAYLYIHPRRVASSCWKSEQEFERDGLSERIHARRKLQSACAYLLLQPPSPYAVDVALLELQYRSWVNALFYIASYSCR